MALNFWRMGLGCQVLQRECNISARQSTGTEPGSPCDVGDVSQCDALDGTAIWVTLADCSKKCVCARLVNGVPVYEEM